MTAVVVQYGIVTPSAQKNVSKESVVVKQGLATSWIDRLYHESKKLDYDISTSNESLTVPRFHLPIYIRSSNFKLPKQTLVPVIMIGPGTGVAPFRGFVKERYQEALKGNTVGPTWLFYGCRHESQDFLYSTEFSSLNSHIKDKALPYDFHLITAFSRQGSQKVYVQHRMDEYKEILWDLLENKKGYFYVCGDAKSMATDVNKKLERIAVEFGKMSESQGKEWVKRLRSRGRYLEDVWS